MTREDAFAILESLTCGGIKAAEPELKTQEGNTTVTYGTWTTSVTTDTMTPCGVQHVEDGLVYALTWTNSSEDPALVTVGIKTKAIDALVTSVAEADRGGVTSKKIEDVTVAYDSDATVQGVLNAPWAKAIINRWSLCNGANQAPCGDRSVLFQSDWNMRGGWRGQLW